MNNNNIGIIVHNLLPSQLSFLTFNQSVFLHKQGFSPFIFYENNTPFCMTPKVNCMNVVEAYDFSGHLIATNINQANLISNFKNDCKKYFYIWDLEWLRNKKHFDENIRAYRNPELDLIARSTDHAKVIKNYCNREPRVVENFNLAKIITLSEKNV